MASISFLHSPEQFSLVALSDGVRSLTSHPLHKAGGHGLLVRGEVSGKFRLIGGQVTAFRRMNDRIILVPEGTEIEIVEGHMIPSRFDRLAELSPELRGMFEVVASW